MSQTEPSPVVVFETKASFTNLPVFLKDLHPIILTVTDVDPAVFRYPDAAHRAKLLRWRRTGIVWAEVRIIRLFTVCAPVPFVSSGVGVKDDDPMIADAVGDVDFVGRRINLDIGRTRFNPVWTVAAFDFARVSDLQEKLAGARELEHMRILRAWRSGWGRASVA